MSQIEQVLLDSFADYSISKGEKYALRELFKEYGTDTQRLNYIRNRAFEIAREHMFTTEENSIETLKWIEEVVKAIDYVQEQHRVTSSVVFSPGKRCVEQIQQLSQQARHCIDVCVFTISDNKISRELINAHSRGVIVRIITDNLKSEDLGSDINDMERAGISVKMDRSDSHMHHKFAIFDKRTLVNGSFNWTRSASLQNQENLVVTDERSLIQQFSDEFERLWGLF